MNTPNVHAVGWNGGLGGWAERLGRRFMAFALCSFRRTTIAPTALSSAVHSVASVI
jgi:hypothetical protein